ncbi:pyridoxamine 5'-phosphate oxidase family protein [Niveibacterium umoris]|uniref:Pyridoxamine 5'-phosphate oxidase N-terminal domain-containing protein n=1 Tax=Niveibacterium umoris TaxID=1193620 RepID=A0A840BM11_9RHOO|nr:pyridoxamine 5'-phosphate oxidase family protein [Niveibacterium umoris]MBB4014265.1 hypothetical protein [Niveibacterium umoris]
MPPDSHTVHSLQQLGALLGPVSEVSTRKEVPYIAAPYRAMIEASPFAILATSGPDGLDASPRGDAPGFVVVEDEKTLLLPERRGNNRADSLRNLIGDPRMALLFLIPGVGETLRVNGRARISVAPDLLARFVVRGQAPKCVLVIDVESAYYQCSRAVVRAQLWTAPAATGVPSAGQINALMTDGAIDAEAFDRVQPARIEATLY